MTDDLTPEAVKAALDGATKGKRVQFHPDYCDEAKGSDWKTWDTTHDTSVIRRDGTRYKGYSHHKHAADATLDNIAPDLAREYLRLKEVEKAGKALAEWADLQWCDHSETYRGGTIWEICSICGRKWADDEGGRPEDEGKEPDQITAFRAAVEGK